MNIDVDRWLECLPIAEARTGDGMVIAGQLTAGPAHGVWLLVGELCLAFRLGDILEVVPVAPTERSVASTSQQGVRVLVRRGAPLLDVGLSKATGFEERQRRPFALSARPLTTQVSPCPHFLRLEREFLLRESLIDK
jgi:hypothetical protein